MKNKYIKQAHITESKFKEILECFCNDFSATQTSQITKIGRKTVNKIFNKIRYRIIELTEKEEKLSGEVEIDESYFGARRVRGKKDVGQKERYQYLGY